jgi:cytochrome P450
MEQVRLQEEADGKIAGATATFAESQSLEATLNAVYETLRLYPTVPNFPRECAVDCKIGGYDIPKGSRVVVNLMGPNRNAKWFAEPDEFRPTRFTGIGLPKPSQPIGAPGAPDFAFLPFGAGSRTCIGQRLAVLEAVQILSAVMKNFSVRLPADAPVVIEHSSITLRPKGLRLIFEKRN